MCVCMCVLVHERDRQTDREQLKAFIIMRQEMVIPDNRIVKQNLRARWLLGLITEQCKREEKCWANS